MKPTFFNEHLWPGQLGHFFIVLSFIGTLLSLISFWRAAVTETTDATGSNSWRKMGRISFSLHFISVIGIFSTLYYIITHHLFEYNYAFQHSNRELPTKYLLSCFWEGQEGSFMLWTFWQSLLGLIVMRTSKTLEARTMTIISLVQLCLATMILGIYFSPTAHIGTTPFLLLRDQMQGAPIFSMPNYMQFIQDGNGLNKLLQNYWMVIHPPILFLGFSATLIPFSFALAALWRGEYKDWIRPASLWCLFAGAVLGTGIMMGGAWAYESLTFGGYWAWDPVENASLVPWLTLIAGLHTLVIFRATGRSLFVTILFLGLSYLLVWYSTFLTRTGILSNTSVHAFTLEKAQVSVWKQPLTIHLILVCILLGIITAALMIWRRKTVPRVKAEEETSTREFWMFIGSFLLILSTLHIIIVTSIPVWSPLWEKMTGRNVAPPAAPVAHYNSIQLWIAIFIALLSAGALFLKFKHTEMKLVWRRLTVTAVIATGLSLLIGLTQKIGGFQYWIYLFAACYGLSASVYYAFFVQKGAWKKRGAALSHFGFAMVLVGILLSSYNKEVISINTTGFAIDFGKREARNDEEKEKNDRDPMENVLLFRNTPVAMGNYFATYLGDSLAADGRTYYKVKYDRVEDGKTVESFYLYPDAFVNPKEGLQANPASKHYLTYDVFTYVTQVLDPSKMQDTVSYKEYTVRAGDSIFFNNGYLIFRGFNKSVDPSAYVAQTGDVAVGALLDAYSLKGKEGTLEPLFIIRGDAAIQREDTLRTQGVFVRFTNIIPSKESAVITLKQTDPKDDFIVLKAIVFPYINVLWLGIIIMVLGFFLSLYNRYTKKKAAAPAETV